MTIIRNSRMVAFVCPKCSTVFKQKFEEYWRWSYTGGNPVIDENNDLLTYKDGRLVKTPYELKLVSGDCFGKPHTRWLFCPNCDHQDEIDLRKKKYRHLRRPPPTEAEYSNDRVKMGWE